MKINDSFERVSRPVMKKCRMSLRMYGEVVPRVSTKSNHMRTEGSTQLSGVGNNARHITTTCCFDLIFSEKLVARTLTGDERSAAREREESERDNRRGKKKKKGEKKTEDLEPLHLYKQPG